MKTETFFASARQDWTTPRGLFDALHAEFAFTLDAAASADNALCAQYFTEADDALRQRWTGRVWVNPPYSRQVGRWVRKAWESVYLPQDLPDADCVCERVVMLVAARTDTRWWHDYVMSGSEIRFIRGRLKFGGSANAAPFPSALVVFDRTGYWPVRVSSLESARGRE